MNMWDELLAAQQSALSFYVQDVDCHISDSMLHIQQLMQLYQSGVSASVQSMQDQLQDILLRECGNASMLQVLSIVQEQALAIAEEQFQMCKAE